MAPRGEPEVRLHAADTVADHGAALPAHHLEGAPDVPAEAREEMLALKSSGLFVCTRRDGDIAPARATGEGFYAHDTRHLSELRVTVGGLRPVLLSSVMESGHHAVVNATNPVLRTGDGMPVLQETLHVRRTLLIADRLFYRVGIHSFHTETVSILVEVSLAADFADVFEVRGVGRRTSGELSAPTHEQGRLRFGYLAGDSVRRETLVELDPAPVRVQADDDGRLRASWVLELGTGEASSLLITVIPSGKRGRSVRRPLERSASTLETSHKKWVADCAQITTDNELFDRLIDASMRDLHALMTPARRQDQLPPPGSPGTWRPSAATRC